VALDSVAVARWAQAPPEWHWTLLGACIGLICALATVAPFYGIRWLSLRTTADSLIPNLGKRLWRLLENTPLTHRATMPRSAYDAVRTPLAVALYMIVAGLCLGTIATRYHDSRSGPSDLPPVPSSSVPSDFARPSNSSPVTLPTPAPTIAPTPLLSPLSPDSNSMHRSQKIKTPAPGGDSMRTPDGVKIDTPAKTPGLSSQTPDADRPRLQSARASASHRKGRQAGTSQNKPSKSQYRSAQSRRQRRRDVSQHQDTNSGGGDVGLPPEFDPRGGDVGLPPEFDPSGGDVGLPPG